MIGLDRSNGSLALRMPDILGEIQTPEGVKGQGFISRAAAAR